MIRIFLAVLILALLTGVDSCSITDKSTTYSGAGSGPQDNSIDERVEIGRIAGGDGSTVGDVNINSPTTVTTDNSDNSNTPEDSGE